MSMTTAPVTTGGSTLCSTARAEEVDQHADEQQHQARDEDGAGDLGGGRRRCARIAATPPTNAADVPR